MIGLACWALSGCASAPGASKAAPRSTMTRAGAIAIAKLVATSIGGRVYTIAPTGSMRPTLDEGSVVMAEVVGWEQLHQGDIVIYRATDGDEVIHRLYARRGDHWIVLGDNNTAVDRETVTAENLLGRVCGIFYTSGKPVARTTSGLPRTLQAAAR